MQVRRIAIWWLKRPLWQPILVVRDESSSLDPDFLFSLAHCKAVYSIWSWCSRWEAENDPIDEISPVRNAWAPHNLICVRASSGLTSGVTWAKKAHLLCPYRWREVGTGATLLWRHHWKPQRKNPSWIQSPLRTSGCPWSAERAKRTLNINS